MHEKPGLCLFSLVKSNANLILMQKLTQLGNAKNNTNVKNDNVVKNGCGPNLTDM